jgi:hypothetical protein
MDRCDNCGVEIETGRCCEKCRETCLDHGVEEEEDREEITEEEFEGDLCNAIDLTFNEVQPVKVRTFAEDGLLTRDRGLVVKFRSGEEFQITIVRSE